MCADCLAPCAHDTEPRFADPAEQRKYERGREEAVARIKESSRSR
jgi:hypothetical protein